MTKNNHEQPKQNPVDSSLKTNIILAPHVQIELDTIEEFYPNNFGIVIPKENGLALVIPWTSISHIDNAAMTNQ